jgi:tetratricopeptide (TPR) repeat protein
MINENSDLPRLIPAWMAATRAIKIQVLPPAKEMKQRVGELRTRVRGGDLNSVVLEPNEEGLAILSRITFELASEGTSDPEVRFREATATYELVSAWSPSSDEFQERNEILFNLALTAWRVARYVRPYRTAQEWERRYQAAFSKATTVRLYLEDFLDMPPQARTPEFEEPYLLSSVNLHCLCSLLREKWGYAAPKVAEEAARLNSFVARRRHFFSDDEATFLLGDTALVAGTACRFIGDGEKATGWLDEAEAYFSETVDAEVQLARVLYARLALAYQMKTEVAILPRVSRLLAFFAEGGMTHEFAKCLFLEASVLRHIDGKADLALRRLFEVRELLSQPEDRPFLGLVLSKIGEIYGAEQRNSEAFEFYRRALDILGGSRPNFMLANLKCSVGETLVGMGKLVDAIEVYRECIADHAACGMKGSLAYVRILLAEALFLAERFNEAELEILAALPTIQQQNMVKHGLAAVTLLRESVLRCNTDRDALRRVREYMNGGWQ